MINPKKGVWSHNKGIKKCNMKSWLNNMLFNSQTFYTWHPNEGSGFQRGIYNLLNGILYVIYHASVI